MRKEFDDYVAELKGVRSVYNKSTHTFSRPDGTALCKSEISPRSSIFMVIFPDFPTAIASELPSCAEVDKSGQVRIRVISRSRLEVCKKIALQRLG
ncbi:hypothetical protein IT157_08795 [bacterium]|nr:hypothetical protein [bacterium]